MAEYAKISLEMLVSGSSTYQPVEAKSNFANYESGSATLRWKFGKVTAATGGTTLDLGEFATVTQVLLKNNDTSNYTDTTHRTTAGAATNQNARCAAGQILALGVVTVATDIVLTANTAACEIEYAILGT